MILHTINKSSPSQALPLCLRFAAPGDIVLLLEDGVCQAVVGSSTCRQLLAAEALRIVAIEEDITCRGLDGKLPPAVEVIDYKGFVDLCCECDKVQSWF